MPNPEILNQIAKVRAPKPFTRQNLTELASNQVQPIDPLVLQEEYQKLSLEQLNAEYLKKVIEVLKHPELENLIDQGQIAFAMIKPDLYLNVKHSTELTENTLSSILISHLLFGDPNKPQVPTSELHLILSDLSIILSLEEIDTFYKGLPKNSQQKFPPIAIEINGKRAKKYGQPDKFPNRWEQYKKYMSSGPVSVLLFYSPDGTPENPVSQIIRDRLGHWNVEDQQTSQPGTLRTEHAKDNFTSLVHASRQPEEVKQELAIIIQHLEKLCQMKNY